MNRGVAVEVPLELDRTTADSLPRQVADGLRDQVRRGSLRPGWRLPSTRGLARQLAISRAVVQMAYDQLHAEGWTESRVGAGTFVAQVGRVPASRSARDVRRSSADVPAQRPPVSLRPGTPLTDRRAGTGWRRAWREMAAAAPPQGYPDPFGLPELRAAIADYLTRARAVACRSDEVLVTSGTTHGLRLLLETAFPARTRIGVEDPGYRSAVGAVHARGAQLVDCRVDGDGLVVDELPDRLAAVYTTPAHQYPLGGRLSAARRNALVGWARAHHTLVVEDDYDGEFRYDVAPLPALAQLDREYVVYLGTVSKVLGPAIRLGWLVADADLVERIAAARPATGDWPSWPLQRAMLAMFADGAVDHAVRHGRRVYAERCARVCAALEPYGTVVGRDAGLHVSLLLPAGVDDTVVRARAAYAGVDLEVLTQFRRTASGPSGLVIGYAGCTDAELDTGLAQLREILAGRARTRTVGS